MGERPYRVTYHAAGLVGAMTVWATSPGHAAALVTGHPALAGDDEYPVRVDRVEYINADDLADLDPSDRERRDTIEECHRQLARILHDLSAT